MNNSPGSRGPLAHAVATMRGRAWGHPPTRGSVPHLTLFRRHFGAYSFWEVASNMEKPTIDKHANREQLRHKRERLFEEYSKHPMNTSLSIEIKLIDDQIAELTAQLVQETKDGHCS
jgi:hypothetical protein